MPKQAPVSTTSRITLAASDACEVFIAGSLNDWITSANPMTRDDQGWRETELELPPGRYEYKFVVDGQWCCEAGCDRPNGGSEGCTPKPFGDIEPRARRSRARAVNPALSYDRSDPPITGCMILPVRGGGAASGLGGCTNEL